MEKADEEGRLPGYGLARRWRMLRKGDEVGGRW